EERALLAQTLIESLDEVTEKNVNDKWLEEINRRDIEIKSGKISCKPADEVLKAANERLKCSNS
ncbi:MAG: addiction module protein, partial [Acidobacteriota bacterium]